MSSNQTVKITLKKSLIGRLEKQILTAKSLGLTKIGDSKVITLDDSVKGKIAVISHLVEVTEA